jgi:hypothetical protein
LLPFSVKGDSTNTESASATGRRLVVIAGVYVVLAIIGAVLSLAYDVGAEPGGDPADDLAFRGTALATPLFLPIVLIVAAALARTRGWAGVIGAAAVGLVGVAFFLGGIFNLPNDLDAARAAGSPTALTIAFGVVTAIFGLLFRRSRGRGSPRAVPSPRYRRALMRIPLP